MGDGGAGAPWVRGMCPITLRDSAVSPSTGRGPRHVEQGQEQWPQWRWWHPRACEDTGGADLGSQETRIWDHRDMGTQRPLCPKQRWLLPPASPSLIKHGALSFAHTHHGSAPICPRLSQPRRSRAKHTMTTHPLAPNTEPLLVSALPGHTALPPPFPACLASQPNGVVRMRSAHR